MDEGLVRGLPCVHLLPGHPVLDDRDPRRRFHPAGFVHRDRPGRGARRWRSRGRVGGSPTRFPACEVPRLDGVSVRSAVVHRVPLQHRVQAGRRFGNRRLPRRRLVPAAGAVTSATWPRVGCVGIGRVPDGQVALPHLRREHRFDDGRRVRVLDLVDPVDVRTRLHCDGRAHRASPGALRCSHRVGDAVPRHPRALLPPGRRDPDRGAPPPSGVVQVGATRRAQRCADRHVVVRPLLRTQLVPERHGMGEAGRRTPSTELGAAEARGSAPIRR